MKFSFARFFTFVVVIVFSQACSLSDNISKNEVAPSDDPVIGATIDSKILEYIGNNSAISYFEPADYPAVYTYIDDLRQKIEQHNPPANSTNYGLDSPTITTNSCATHIRVIDQSNVTNAFVVPGNYVYLYKDLLLKIKTEAQFVAVLTHLITCSRERFPIQKLEDRFSVNFLLDLSLGGGLNSSSSIDIKTIMDELENVPYPVSVVEHLDTKAESKLCELDYDILSYSNLFTDMSSQNLDWYTLFPRPSITDYATHLFNDVSSPSCSGEEDGSNAYTAFKQLF